MTFMLLSKQGAPLSLSLSLSMAQRQHIILFPFMAQGHLIPFMALGRLLEQKTGYTITLVNTPLNIKSLKSSLPPNTSIQLTSLPFNSSDHGLPPNVENTDALPLHNFLDLFNASQTLQPSFERLVSNICSQDGHPPLCIISDLFLGWTFDVAKKFGAFHSVFIASGAYGTAVLFSLWLNLPHRHVDKDEFMLPDFPEASLIKLSRVPSHLAVADGADPWSRFMQTVFSFCLRSDAFLFNTVEELDRSGMWYFSRKTNRPGWAVGPITSSSKNGGRAQKAEAGISVSKCISWLNLHPPSSVLYVCFGSQNTISASEMMELAMGLEASGKPFIWVIRPPVGFDINEEFRAEWLPKGFEDGITEREQGILVRKWAPQMEILVHPSTVAFLSHRGWNSVLESLINGVPLIGWPLAAEQFSNLNMLEEVGVCVHIASDQNYINNIDRFGVERVLEVVMGGTKRGDEMKRKALSIKEMLQAASREDEGFKGSSVKAIEEFIATALSAKKKKKCAASNDS